MSVAASGAGDKFNYMGAPARALGDTELQALRALRLLAESHVRTALKRAGNDLEVLKAASTPGDFIDLGWLDQYIFLAEDLWEHGINVVNDLFGSRMSMPLAPRQYVWNLARNAIDESRESYLDLLKALVQKHAYPLNGEPVLGEFRTGSAVQYGDVRGLLVQLGGGSVDPTVELYGGVTTGTTMQNYLAETGINAEQKIWLYGWEEQPRRTFNGHLQMDGLVFEEWDDNGLIISPQDRWLRRNYYAPGDHWGCACVVSPYFPNMGEPFEI